MDPIPTNAVLSLTLLAFGFGSGWMLWFLGGAAAPIIIHLWNRRRHREMRWAAMEYLLAAIRNNSRRITIEQLILLLIRTLIVVLLALAVAEPFLDLNEGWGGVFWPAMIGLIVLPTVLWLGIFSRLRWHVRTLGVLLLLAVAGLPLLLVDFSSIDPFQVTAVASRRTHRVVVIDGSYSMAYRPSDESRFGRAQALARRIVAESSLGDGFTLVLMAEPPRVVVGTPVFGRDDFLDEINNLRMPHTGGDLNTTLKRVEEVLQTARRDHPKLVRHEVHLVSDLGKTSWNPSTSTAQKQLRRQAAELSKLAGLVVYDVGQPETQNAAVTGVQLTRFLGDRPVKFATVRRDVTVKFDVRNYSSQEKPQQVVELWVDGRRSDDTTVDLPGNGQSSAKFQYRFDSPGEHAIEVRLAADPLEIDNRRWLTVPVKQHLRALIVDHQAGAPRVDRPTFLLSVALEYQRNADRRLAQADVVDEGALRQRDLSQYDVVFLCNVAQFNREEAHALGRYVARGGTLVAFLGDRVRADNYNTWLAGGGGDDLPRVLPAKLAGVVERDAARIANEPAFASKLDHEFVQIFRGRTDAKFVEMPVFKWFKLLPHADGPEGGESTARVALKFYNGDPAIVEHRLGRGRSIVFATSAGADNWAPMGTHAAFQPLIWEVLSAALTGPFETRNVRVGDPLSGTTDLLGNNARVAVKTPWKTTTQVPIRAFDDHGRWSFSDTTLSGVYRAAVPRAVPPEIAFAVNVDTRESDLAKVSESELKQDVLAGVPFKYVTNWQSLDADGAVVAIQRRFFDAWVLAAICGLLLIETFLAWFFGRHGT